MTVHVRIPTILRSYTGGAAEVTATEGTLREVITGLDAAYPGLGGYAVLGKGGPSRLGRSARRAEAGSGVPPGSRHGPNLRPGTLAARAVLAPGPGGG